MKLFTKEIDKKLFAQYSMGSNLENQMVVAKIFNPYGRGVWYLLNSDPNDPDYLWAIVNLFEVEMGSVSRSELESILVPPFRLPLERDLYFTPVNAKVLYDGLLQGKHYAKGGGVDTPLSQAKKKVASMSDSEVAEEVETILAYEMMDYDETGEDLMNDMKAARMFLVEHYEEQFTDTDAFAFGNGGSIGTTHYHKHNPNITFKILDYTNNGVKGLQKNPKSLSRKERNEGIITYYSTNEFRDLFEKERYAEGGGIGEIKEGDEVIWRDNNYIIAKITDNRIGGFVDKKYELYPTKIGVKGVIIDSLKGVSKVNYANGGGVGYQHDVNIVTNREGENYLFPSDKEDNSMGVLLKRGGRASEVLKDTDYVSNRKIDAVIIDGKRYDGKSIIDGVYLRKTASGSADMPQQSAAPVVEPSKPKPAKPTRKPKPMSDGGELLISQLAETDAQMFERRFGVSVKQIADELKGYDKNSVLRGDAERTYESISGKEVSDIERGAFYKFLLAGFSFYDIKLGKSKAIFLPTFDEQDLDNGLRIHVKPQYAKPLSKEGFLSMKNILGTDELRPIMMCVYFDDGNLIGTDAHKLVIIKQTQSESELKPIFKDLIKKEVNKYAGGKEGDTIIENYLQKIFDGGLDKKPINFTTGMFDDGTKFPNYQAIIPKNTEYSESVSIQALIDACNGVYEAQNNCYEIIKNIRFNFINGQEEQEIAFNSEFLLDTLQVLQVNGAKSVKLNPSTPTRACGIYADNGNYALIMPIMTDYSINAPCNYSIPMQTSESNYIPSESVIAKFKYKAGGKITEAQREKIETVMDEYGQGKLNIGLSDKKVTNRKQAVAIALSEAGVSNKSKRGWKHKK